MPIWFLNRARSNVASNCSEPNLLFILLKVKILGYAVILLQGDLRREEKTSNSNSNSRRAT